jgi:DNA-binding GntR family transcriptional regulator
MHAGLSELTPLQQRIAREIVALVRRGNHAAGDHLPELHIAAELGTSRSPVQAALQHLARLGVLYRDANRGYFLAKGAHDWAEVAAGFSTAPDDPLYVRIALDRQSGALADEVSESELMRRYDVARSTLRKVLARIAEEGWIEQRVGQGWSFQSLIDSTSAYEESYLFRQTVEPSGILGPSFCFVPSQLAELRREQQRIVDGGYVSLTPIEQFESNSRFHQTIADWSNNRFISHAVRRVNQLRRLVEYRIAALNERRVSQSSEHLSILAAIESHDLIAAAGLMRAHLDGARRSKAEGQTPFR